MVPPPFEDKTCTSAQLGSRSDFPSIRALPRPRPPPLPSPPLPSPPSLPNQGTHLCDYEGELLDRDEFDRRYPDGVVGHWRRGGTHRRKGARCLTEW